MFDPERHFTVAALTQKHWSGPCLAKFGVHDLLLLDRFLSEVAESSFLIGVQKMFIILPFGLEDILHASNVSRSLL